MSGSGCPASVAIALRLHHAVHSSHADVAFAGAAGADRSESRNASAMLISANADSENDWPEAIWHR